MYQGPTELLWIGCLTELIWILKFKSSVSTPNTNLQTYWQEGISHATSGTIFFICLISAISFLSAALRISAWPAAPKRWWKGCKNRKERTGSWQSRSRRRWTWPSLSRQVLRLWTVRLRRKALGYPKHPLEQTGQGQGKLDARDRCSVEFSRMAKRCISGWKYRETCLDRRRPGTLEFPWKIGKYREICRARNSRKVRRLRRLGNRRQLRLLSTQSFGGCVLDRETKIWSQSDGSKEITWFEHSDMEYIYVCHSASCSSFWERLHGKSEIYQESTFWNLWNNYFLWLRGWSRIRQKLLDWHRLIGSSLCRETTLLTDRAVQFAAAETFVFSDSVLCLRGISDEPVEAWESRIKRFLEARYLEDVDRIDGDQMEFELKIFQGFTKLGILDEVQKMMTKSTCEPEQFKGRLIFMSMFTDIFGELQNGKKC